MSNLSHGEDKWCVQSLGYKLVVFKPTYPMLLNPVYHLWSDHSDLNLIPLWETPDRVSLLVTPHYYVQIIQRNVRDMRMSKAIWNWVEHFIFWFSSEKKKRSVLVFQEWRSSNPISVIPGNVKGSFCFKFSFIKRLIATSQILETNF